MYSVTCDAAVDDDERVRSQPAVGPTSSRLAGVVGAAARRHAGRWSGERSVRLGDTGRSRWLGFSSSSAGSRWCSAPCWSSPSGFATHSPTPCSRCSPGCSSSACCSLRARPCPGRPRPGPGGDDRALPQPLPDRGRAGRQRTGPVDHQPAADRALDRARPAQPRREGDEGRPRPGRGDVHARGAALDARRPQRVLDARAESHRDQRRGGRRDRHQHSHPAAAAPHPHAPR